MKNFRSVHSRLLSSIAVLVLATTSTLAHADTFDYIFVDSAPGFQTSFTYDSPTLITTNTSFTPDTCSFISKNLPCNKVIVDFSDATLFVLDIDSMGNQEGSLSVGSSPAFIALFTTVGDHVVGNEEVDVIDVPAVTSATTPEPYSLVLFGTGFLGIAGVARRKFALQ